MISLIGDRAFGHTEDDLGSAVVQNDKVIVDGID